MKVSELCILNRIGIMSLFGINSRMFSTDLAFPLNHFSTSGDLVSVE